MSAAPPATCGVAIDVPLRLEVAVSLVFHDETMPSPGAKMSVQVPKLENDARASVRVLALTVIASATRAGVKLQASLLLLPAAMAKTTPSAIALRTAVSTVALAPEPPRLMLATAGAPAAWLPATQSMPAATPAKLPEPWQLSTLTAVNATPLATPYCEPPMVPATWVPWPLQSVLLPSPVVLVPQTARPPKVGVRDADAGVDDVGAHVGRRRGIGVAVVQRQVALVDAVQAPRRRVQLRGLGVHRTVLLDVGHLGQGRELARGRGAHRAGEAAQRV